MKQPLCAVSISIALALQISCEKEPEPNRIEPSQAGTSGEEPAPSDEASGGANAGSEPGAPLDGGRADEEQVNEEQPVEDGGAGGAKAETPAAAGGAVEPEESPESPDGDAVYAFTTQVFGVEISDTQSYVLLTKDLARAPSLDDAAVEVSGRALGVGPEGEGKLFLASDSGPSVTRYDLTAEGTLKKAGTVSFLGQGVATFLEYGGQFQFVSEEKAYWFDPIAAKIVIFNPSAMTVRGSIPLDELAFEGEGLSFTAVPRRKGKMLYSFPSWRTGPVPVTVPDRAAVIALDTETDAVQVVMDARCGYVRDGILARDGYLYLATEALGSAVNYLNAGYASAPCLLRFDLAAGAFDAGFRVELPRLFDGESAGSLILSPSGQPLLRFLDRSLLPRDPEDPINLNPRFLASAPVWRWARVTLGDEPSAERLASPASIGSILPLELGARTYAPVFDARASTEIHELTDDGLVPAMQGSISGLVFTAVKLR